MHVWAFLAILVACDEPEQLPSPRPTAPYAVLDLVTETASRMLADMLLRTEPETYIPLPPATVHRKARG